MVWLPLASVMIRPAGPELKVVIGGATSSHVRVAGDGSTFPARSTARTRKVCMPGSRPETSPGESHGSQSGKLSTRHSYSSWRIGVALSVPVNSNRDSGRPTFSPLFGPEKMAVPGGEVSLVIVHVCDTGGPALPSASGTFGFSIAGSKLSTARTWKVCWPGLSSGSPAPPPSYV